MDSHDFLWQPNLECHTGKRSFQLFQLLELMKIEVYAVDLCWKLNPQISEIPFRTKFISKRKFQSKIVKARIQDIWNGLIFRFHVNHKHFSLKRVKRVGYKYPPKVARGVWSPPPYTWTQIFWNFSTFKILLNFAIWNMKTLN